MLIRSNAAHNLYQAGQIQLLNGCQEADDREASPSGGEAACYTRTLSGEESFAVGHAITGRSGETGRRAGFKIPWGSLPVWVRVPPPAPHASTAPDVLAL